MIETDGCTGFPDVLFGHDMTQCCTGHDGGKSDGWLLDCLDQLGGNEWWFIVLVGLGVAIMRIGRPVYNLLQRWGILPKTTGSKF